MFYSHKMSTSFSPVLLKLSTHLQSFITKITPLRVNKSAHHKHHIFLTIIKWKMNWEINTSKSGKDRDKNFCDNRNLYWWLWHWLTNEFFFICFFVCTFNVPLGFAGECCCIYTVTTGMYCCEGYGFQAVYSKIGCIYQRVLGLE